VRSQGNGLADAIEQTNDVQEWFDEVSDVWNRRLASLYRFDAQLTAGNDRFEWVDDDAQSAVTAQRDALKTSMGVVDDRWLEGVSRRHDHGTGYRASALLEAHLDQQEISEFVERIADHPWVIPATDLPTGVQVAMEHEYITPLRELRRWYETVDGAIASLFRMTKTRFCRLLMTSLTSSHSPRPSTTT